MRGAGWLYQIEAPYAPDVDRLQAPLPGSRRVCNKTNLQNKGLISADRGTKATLVRTIPRSLFKSYTKDLSFSIFELVFQYRPDTLLCVSGTVTMLWYWPEGYCYSCKIREHNVSPLSSMDSGLEAFSRNPTHGSFSALTFQSTEFANYVNQRFLSY
jgi:hypothetical protein